MPGVCAVLWSRESAGITRTPWSFQPASGAAGAGGCECSDMTAVWFSVVFRRCPGQLFLLLDHAFTTTSGSQSLCDVGVVGSKTLA